MSSRNSYLGAERRRVAAKLNRVLKDVVAWARSGDLRAAEQRGARALLDAGFDSVDYVAVRDGETLAMIEMLDRPARVLAAVRLGPVRLIDNMAIV
jgi:pantoate--beta-alanine ligase